MKTKFEELDERMGGFQEGHLILLGGRPAMGKTAFLLSLLDNVCLEGEECCVIFSLEHEKKAFLQRLAELHAGISVHASKDNEEYYERTRAAYVRMEKSKLWIWDDVDLSVREMLGKCQEVAKREKIGLIAIDYIQLINEKGFGLRKWKTRQVIKQLKKMAKRFHCPVLLLSQLSKSADLRWEHRPILADVKGVKAELADDVLLLYRYDYYEQNPETEKVAELEIAKGERARGERVRLYFSREYGHFFTD